MKRNTGIDPQYFQTSLLLDCRTEFFLMSESTLFLFHFQSTDESLLFHIIEDFQLVISIHLIQINLEGEGGFLNILQEFLGVSTEFCRLVQLLGLLQGDVPLEHSHDLRQHIQPYHLQLPRGLEEVQRLHGSTHFIFNI